MAFDVIILDIHLTPIDGAEVLRRIRKSGRAYANIPAVVITANDAVGSTAECMSAGADLFLTKPVRKEELLQTINFLQFEVPRSGVKSAASWSPHNRSLTSFHRRRRRRRRQRNPRLLKNLLLKKTRRYWFAQASPRPRPRRAL